MKKNLLFSISAVLLSGAMFDAQAAVDPSRVLTTVSSFGDFMGMAPDDQITSQRSYLYSQDLKVVAVIESACAQKSTELYTQYYNPYVYDESGNLVLLDRYQYGLYDYGDRVMHHAAGSVEYRYDEQGNCIEQIEDQNVVTFEYDAEGNCVKETHFTNGNASKTLEFSDFSAGKNLPAIVVSTHENASFTGEFYEESREYDAEGRLVKAQRICNRDYVEDHGLWQITTAYGDFMQEEHWSYDGSQLMLYEKFTSIDEESGELIPYLKTQYTVKDANTVGYQSYTYFGGEWYKSGVYQEESYLDFSAMAESSALQLVNVSKAVEGENDAVLEFTKPSAVESNAAVSFNIYRNGELIATVKTSDAALSTNEAGNFVYVDSNVQSGVYDYLVQTVVDDACYCVSNIMQIDLTIEFPVVTNVRAIESVKTDKDLNYVTILFRVPQDAVDYGFVSNELLVGNAQVGEDKTTDPTVNQLHCTLGDDAAYVTILTRYQLGKSVSERVWIDVNHLSSIEEVIAQGNGEMKIFDINGCLVTAPIESLHGTYIVISGNKISKIILK